MNKLWVRLSVAFALVAVVGVLASAEFARRQVDDRFRSFVARSLILGFGDEPSADLVTALAEHYGSQGDWLDVNAILWDHEPPFGPGRGRAAKPGPATGADALGSGQADDNSGQPRGRHVDESEPVVPEQWRRGARHAVLADADGRVVYAGPDRSIDVPLTEREQQDAMPIAWQGETVGYLLAPPGGGPLPPGAEVFLVQTRDALLQAALIAAALGVILGLVVARGVAAPLSRLADAARRISRGELDERVPEGGADEVADLARAFNEMADSLQESETLRANMVADIAHELRTPLTVVQGNLRAILDDVYPLDMAEIASVYDETIMLSRLVDDLRELADADAGQLRLELQPTALEPIVAGAVSLFGEMAREAEVTLEASIPESLPDVVADPIRTRQIVSNLLSNAIRHTPAGGVTVVAAEVVPSDESRGDTAMVRLAVSDTGSGIAPDLLPHLFDRFWREEGSRTRAHGGSGLGLAIARQLVEAQGGRIGADSDEGHGSTFWFELPVQASDPLRREP